MTEKTAAQVAYEMYYGVPGCWKDGTPKSEIKRWMEIADAVIAHHEAQRRRPISEAPKDGRAILAVNENGWARVVEWQGNAWFLLGGDCYYLADFFTHWYELPGGGE